LNLTISKLCYHHCRNVYKPYYILPSIHFGCYETYF